MVSSPGPSWVRCWHPSVQARGLWHLVLPVVKGRGIENYRGSALVWRELTFCLSPAPSVGGPLDLWEDQRFIRMQLIQWLTSHWFCLCGDRKGSSAWGATKMLSAWPWSQGGWAAGFAPRGLLVGHPGTWFTCSFGTWEGGILVVIISGGPTWPFLVSPAGACHPPVEQLNPCNSVSRQKNWGGARFGPQGCGCAKPHSWSG